MKARQIVPAACLVFLAAAAAQAQDQLPSFTATSLSGKSVTEKKLVGQPTVLIVTPSRAAAEETRRWAQTLRKTLDPGRVAIRDILAIDLPFFISEKDALDRAREKIPERYHDQTYLLAESSLEQALNIPGSSEDAFVLVLDSKGKVTARVKGKPTSQRINEVENAVESMTR